MVRSVIGEFEDLHHLLQAGEKLKENGCRFSTLSPVSIHEEIEPLLGEKKNPIKYLTFTGAFIGFFFGVALILGTAVLYPLPRGGRPLFFIPPIVILSYETTILFGVLSTLAGFFLFSRLPSFNNNPYVPETMAGSFGLLVENIGEIYPEIRRILIEAGAKNVHEFEE